MRQWVRDWFDANPAILGNPHAALSIIVYFCTRPFHAPTTKTFTYDIQRPATLDQAFASAKRKINQEISALPISHLPLNVRRRYFVYRPTEAVRYVDRNRRFLFRILHGEAAIMDAVLKFAIVDIPKIGLSKASSSIRKKFAFILNHLSSEFDMSSRADDLLLVATNELRRVQSD